MSFFCRDSLQIRTPSTVESESVDLTDSVYSVVKDEIDFTFVQCFNFDIKNLHNTQMK